MIFKRKIQIMAFVTAMIMGAAAYAAQPLAEVNGKPLTAEEFQSLLDALKLNLPPGYQITDDQKAKLVDSWVKEELMAQEAVKQGIDKEKVSQYLITESTRQTLAQLLLAKQVLGKVSVSKQELQDFYELNKKEFRTSERVKLKDILVKSKELADQVLAELKSGGNFDKLAGKYSEDQGGSQGAYFQKGEMVPELEKAVFSLKEGQVGGPVKTAAGYYLVKVMALKSAGYKKFDEVQQDVTMAILQKKRQEAAAVYFDSVKSKADIVLRKELLKDVNPH